MNGKHRSDVFLAGDDDRAPHLLDNRLANAQSKSSPRLINLVMLLEVAKIDEKLVYLILGDASSKVLDVQFEMHVACVRLWIKILLLLFQFFKRLTKVRNFTSARLGCVAEVLTRVIEGLVLQHLLLQNANTDDNFAILVAKLD